MNRLTDLTHTIIEAIQDKKGTGITLIDLSKIESSSAQEFIICQGKSTSQVAAIADNIRELVQQKLKVKPFNYDGYRNSQWIVLDYGYLYVHIFIPELRELYNLEELWNDGEITNIPDLD